ncbi:hypothetical protein CASFOL_030920 [Castilleja foliolosa]|uniref:Ninja-family protein n=1 Tax=Castilleja foliolosa TaxID=1961234 RepID=A0ABD3C8M2_9LAMI
MEEEKGLDLSLGLPCGGNSSSQKDKYVSSSDIKSDEGDRGSKLINEFKNFLEGGNTAGTWLTNDSRSTEIGEEKRSSVGEKRKHLFIETNDANLMDKAKASHISITTDEGSTADNEDVAESEVDGSTSRHVSQNDDVVKRFVSSGVDILGGQQKRFCVSSEKEFNAMNVPNMGYSVPFPSQPVNIKDSSLTSCTLPSMMHGMGPTNGERRGVQPVKSANFPLMFGYNPVQLPSLDRDNSRGTGSVSHHQQMQSAYSGRNLVNPDVQNDSRKLTRVISHVSSDDRAALDHGKSYRKQQVGEEGSSSHTEGNTATHQTKDSSDHPKAADSSPNEFPAIRPGIAADLKFGGCGSYPNLPWVSTTGQGPNGRTISGVTYKYSPTQIRIVCACHGTHMSPEEFVRHASAEDSNIIDVGAALTPSPLPGSNPSASAQS